VKRILVCRTDRIGDLILSTPVFEAVKKAYPNCHLGVLVKETTEELLRHNPWIDETIRYRPRELFQLVHQLRKYELTIVLYPTFVIALLCWFARIPVRIGTGYRFYSFLFNRRVHEHRKDCRKHEAEYNMNMLKPLGITGPIKPCVWISDKEREWATQRTQNVEKGNIVAVHPGSGGSSRPWNSPYFGRLADLLQESGFRVLLTAGRGEEELQKQVLSSMTSSPAATVDDADLLQLAAVFERCELLITNSTGPMHLAASCGVPVIGIFCPIKGCTPRRWGPVGDNSRVLIPDVPACDRCVGRRCTYYDCMDTIEPERVLEEVKGLITQIGRGSGCRYALGKTC